nr:HIT family protein [uncultured Sphingomonas sp.]
MSHATLEKFGYPATLIREYRHWALLVRPSQVTAASLVLVSTSDATAFGALPAGAHAELQGVTSDLEAMLTAAVTYDRINYLMLMMVDPHVHFHVIPRYNGERTIVGVSRTDQSWPGPPDLSNALPLSDDQIALMRDELVRLSH